MSLNSTTMYSLHFTFFKCPATNGFIFLFLSGPSLVHTALCYISPTPWDCVKEQAGRALNYWEQTVDDKRHELMGK